VVVNIPYFPKRKECRELSRSEILNLLLQYPPIFRDETALDTPKKSLYGEMFPKKTISTNPAQSCNAPAVRRTRRADHVEFSEDTGELHPDNPWISETKRNMIHFDLSGIPEASQTAAKVKGIDKKPSNVLERPDGEYAERKSTQAMGMC
jgi:hypothetical protein